MAMKLGLYEKAMPDVSWHDKLLAAREAGFDFIEMSVDESDERLARLDWTEAQRRDLLATCRDVGLGVETMCLSGHRKFPLGSGNSATEERSLEIMRKAIALARDLGIGIIQLAGYDVYYDEVSTPATRERFTRNLARSTEMATSANVVLALETMENDFLNTIEKGMVFVREVGSPFLQMYPDMGNVTNGAKDVAADIESGRGHIAAAHLKESRPGIFRNLMYGEGHVDFPLVTRLLREQGVETFTAEFWYDGGEDWRRRLKYAHDFLRALLI